jgi:integrase
MRIGEAIALDRDDVDLDHGQVRARNAKYGKARQLPVHASTRVRARWDSMSRTVMPPA